MTVQDLINKNLFQLKNAGDDLDREITVPFCCDLLSVAMGQAPSGCAWVTVMSNINTLAVTVFATEMPIFDAALIVYKEIHS